MIPEPRTTGEAGAPALGVEVLESIEAVGALQGEWDALFARCTDRNPFLGFDWAISWLGSVGASVRPLVIVVREEARVRAIAPLCVNESRVLTFIGYPQSDYADFILDRDADPASVLELVLAEVFSRRASWRVAVLDQLGEERSSVSALREALIRGGYPFRYEKGDACAAMDLGDPKAATKQYSKSNMSNYINWYRRNGDFRFEVIEDEAVALDRLESLFEQHIERWNGTSTPSSFLRAGMKEFYRDFFRRMHPKGHVRICALRLDEGFLALYLYFELDGVMYMYKPTYNREYSKRSPGQVILRLLLDVALERGVREMDFTRGDEGYKHRFTNLTRQNGRVTVYADRWALRRATLVHDLMHTKVADLLLRNARSRRLKEALLRWHRNR